VSRLDEQMMDESFHEAQTILAADCPQADMRAAPELADTFDAGVWFGIAGCLTVLARHGLLLLVPDGDSRE
jgi:hypothetical protein